MRYEVKVDVRHTLDVHAGSPQEAEEKVKASAEKHITEGELLGVHSIRPDGRSEGES